MHISPLYRTFVHQINLTMTHLLLTILLFIPLPSVEEDIRLLSEALREKPQYDLRYEHRLDSLREIGDAVKMYKAYNSYCYDSALFYIREAVRQRELSGDANALASVKIKLAYTYMSGGLFRECESAFDDIDVAHLSPAHRTGYYSLRGHLLYDISQYEGTPYPPAMRRYYELAIANLSEQDGTGYWNLKAQIARADNRKYEALHCFGKALQGCNGHAPSEAVFMSSMAQIYAEMGDSAQALHYWAQAAVRDIQTSTKEITAMQQVAKLLHALGRYDMAEHCIRSALDDVTHYHARHRQLEVSEILPIIDNYQMEQLQRRNTHIRIVYTCIMSLLLVGILVTVTLLFQLRLRNRSLTEARDKLHLSNVALEQSNHIKETYLTTMLSAEADHAKAVERYSKYVMRCTREKRWDELLTLPQYISKLGQRTAFYHRFDTMFLHLYPHFIEECNRMFQTPLKSKEGCLPTELRVFALMRLGLSDNDRMAHILSCSLATVHTYKARIYANLNVSKETFLHSVIATT